MNCHDMLPVKIISSYRIRCMPLSLDCLPNDKRKRNGFTAFTLCFYDELKTKYFYERINMLVSIYHQIFNMIIPIDY